MSIPAGAVKSMHFLFQVISTIKLDQSNEIHRSIADQELDCTKIVIEFDLTVLLWKLSTKAQSKIAMARFLPSLPEQQDTVIGIHYTVNGSSSDYFVFPVYRGPLLDPKHTLKFKCPDGHTLCNLQDFIWK
ncbi:hypothetical protein GYMLUDRAFT_63877 [Collybiopsis luxurians FD-317 M1]|uniref:Uncharacterized protein n=1 Tax=Collybiopsis luxurians FD-317 M1 TaxID=944289 RepID=A0A0D0BES0_9AGAR|nr:hypothetical protein GYMLUDRAFT_63877 [Collybiopsis luxurians FD-317 M1]